MGHATTRPGRARGAQNRRRIWRLAAAGLGGIWALTVGPLEAAAQAHVPDSVLASPLRRYPAHPWRAAVMGRGWRTLWELPVKAEVLDLDNFAGGLTLRRRGGGQQTASLRFRGADGVAYTFRSVDKDASRGLDPLLRESFVAWAQQDQISAIFPMAALVVAPLLEAVGILHADPRLMVMPDDPRLGDFRDEFKGILGFIEERPNEGPDGEPGFAGSTRVVGTDRLLERLEEGPDNRVDAEDFLRARLMDIYVGDWDRHPDQWRWAGFEEGDLLVFKAVPRDRDWAFTKLDGLIMKVYRGILPHLAGFEEEYLPAFNTTWSGRALDRRFLTGLEWSDWEAVALDMQGRLTDDVIDSAVSGLPPAYLAEVGEYFRRALESRRDGLLIAAREFYDLLAENVDVFGTDEEEYALVEWLEGDRTRVRLWEKDRNEQPRGDPLFDRTFLGGETADVRIFLRGEQDRAVVRGSASSRIRVRVVGGGRDDVLIDETTGDGRVYFHDDRGDNEFVRGRHTKIYERDYEAPDVVESYGAPPRDWGHALVILPGFEVSSKRGTYLEISAARQNFGFRHYPYRDAYEIRAGIGTATNRPMVQVEWRYPVGRLRGTTTARYDGAERFRYFGLGNSSTREPGRDLEFYRVDKTTVSVESRIGWAPARGVAVSLGPRVELQRHRGNTDNFIFQDDPYGFSNFVQFSLGGIVEWDLRDNPTFPTRGGRIEAEARVYPDLGDVRRAYGSVGGTAEGFVQAVALPFEPVLALKVGAEKVWGSFPYQGAAYLGSSSQFRGAPKDRYGGNAVVFAKSEIRLRLTSVRFPLPGQFGVHGMTDVGRVYLGGEDSDEWHWSHGGGVWLSLLKNHTPLISVTVADSEETVKLIVAAGFAF